MRDDFSQNYAQKQKEPEMSKPKKAGGLKKTHVPCSVCHARSGSRCTFPDGEERRVVHQARFDAMRREFERRRGAERAKKKRGKDTINWRTSR
jgi:hypothetical protein